MYKYKRKINNIEQAKKMEFCLSNNIDTYLSMNAFFENRKPYHGLYIKKGKIMLANIIEKIELERKIYKVANFDATSQFCELYDYISSVDLNNAEIIYDLNNLVYSKKLIFFEKDDILCIEYIIENKSNSKAKFTFIPHVTYRELYAMKKMARLKFNQRPVQNGCLLNLSVTNQENLILKSDCSIYKKCDQFFNNVSHEDVDENLNKRIYLEDLYIPGEFQTSIKPFTTQRVRLFVASKDFNVVDEIDEKINKRQSRQLEISNSIKEEYRELKGLELLIDNFDMQDLVSSIPCKNYENINVIGLIDIIKSLEGQYITTNRFDEAENKLVKYKELIKSIELSMKNSIIKTEEDIINLLLLKLWYIEVANRFIQKVTYNDSSNVIYRFIQNEVNEILQLEKTGFDYHLVYLELICLWYNALKVYEFILDKENLKSDNIYSIAEKVKNIVNNDFWQEDKRILKSSLKDNNLYCTVDMIYSISLSYQVASYENSVKILDTIFKELYTPYGLREISKNSENYKGYIYPKYMAHFVKANLRQSGVTRATQKIAYNLVKELMQEIGKHVNGGIKKAYHERGLELSGFPFDLYTISEIVRLYDMLI
ncbi:MAG: glycogen debranching enzyme N-terminal domain-containing protein [Clostridia bacterium]|nr:glycogen debranching enzyme N-terminal domain-containing protein [Clostridia bacterium]